MQLLFSSKKFHPEATQAYRSPNYSHVYGLATTFSTEQPVLLKTSGQLNLKHRGAGYNGVIGYSVDIGIRHAANLASLPAEAHGSPPPFIKGACSSGNLYDVTEHYAEPKLIAQTILTQAGAYRVSVWLTWHSDGCPSGSPSQLEVNGNAGNFLGSPYHQFIVDLFEAPSGVVLGAQQFDGGLWP